MWTLKKDIAQGWSEVVPEGGFVLEVHDGGASGVLLERLPIGSTCFNVLELPQYHSAEVVKVRKSLDHGTIFGYA